MVFFVRITENQSYLRLVYKSTKFNPKIQRTIYLLFFNNLDYMIRILSGQ